MQSDALGAMKALAPTSSLLQLLLFTTWLTITLLQDMQSDALGAIKALASNARVRDTLLSGSHFTGFTGTKVPILTAVCWRRTRTCATTLLTELRHVWVSYYLLD